MGSTRGNALDPDFHAVDDPEGTPGLLSHPGAVVDRAWLMSSMKGCQHGYEDGSSQLRVASTSARVQDFNSSRCCGCYLHLVHEITQPRQSRQAQSSFTEENEHRRELGVDSEEPVDIASGRGGTVAATLVARPLPDQNVLLAQQKLDLLMGQYSMDEIAKMSQRTGIDAHAGAAYFHHASVIYLSLDQEVDAGGDEGDTHASTEHLKTEESVLADRHVSSRHIIAVALSLFTQETHQDDVQAVKPFAAADLGLGSKLGSQVFANSPAESPAGMKHAAVMDAVAMLHVACDAFKLRESTILNMLYILARAADVGICVGLSTYRSLILTALLISIKEYKESCVWTADLRSLFPSLNLSCLRKLEPLLLFAIDYRVSALSGNAVRARILSLIENVRRTEKMLQPSSRSGFVLCRKLISWSRNYLDDIFVPKRGEADFAA